MEGGGRGGCLASGFEGVGWLASRSKGWASGCVWWWWWQGGLGWLWWGPRAQGWGCASRLLAAAAMPRRRGCASGSPVPDGLEVWARGPEVHLADVAVHQVPGNDVACRQPGCSRCRGGRGKARRQARAQRRAGGRGRRCSGRCCRAAAAASRGRGRDHLLAGAHRVLCRTRAQGCPHRGAQAQRDTISFRGPAWAGRYPCCS